MSSGEDKSQHLSNPRVLALRAALRDRDPFYSGMCPIPEYQRGLYYKHGEQLRFVDFSNATSDDLDALYRACKPAEFGRNGESVLDESYRKAGKMDLISFSTLFDPRDLGIHDEVSKALLAENYTMMELELYKLNVYGPGDFFKSHRDTPRGLDMFGSLVVVLPTPHKGGQFVLDNGEKWTIDFTEKFATAAEPSVCFVAFYSDVEHEVLPVTSGHRVTLTYNLYRKRIHPNIFRMMPASPSYHLHIQEMLANLVNDKLILPDGGYLGLGLVHEYVHAGNDLIATLLDQLKGTDRALADACDALGLRCFPRLLYRRIYDTELSLITTEVLEAANDMSSSSSECLEEALGGLSIEQVEGIAIVGTTNTEYILGDLEYYESAREFYRDPITEVLEITPMKSSVNIKTTFWTYGNEPILEYFYGTACMFIALGPAESRQCAGL